MHFVFDGLINAAVDACVIFAYLFRDSTWLSCATVGSQGSVTVSSGSTVVKEKYCTLSSVSVACQGKLFKRCTLKLMFQSECYMIME